MSQKYIDILFEGEGPDLSLVEVEDGMGHGINVGAWVDVGRYQVLRLPDHREQKAEIERLKAIAFDAFCTGYSRGHNDTVEGAVINPAEYPDEWPETLAELLEQKP